MRWSCKSVENLKLAEAFSLDFRRTHHSACRSPDRPLIDQRSQQKHNHLVWQELSCTRGCVPEKAVSGRLRCNPLANCPRRASTSCPVQFLTLLWWRFFRDGARARGYRYRLITYELFYDFFSRATTHEDNSLIPRVLQFSHYETSKASHDELTNRTSYFFLKKRYCQLKNKLKLTTITCQLFAFDFSTASRNIRPSNFRKIHKSENKREEITVNSKTLELKMRLETRTE